MTNVNAYLPANPAPRGDTILFYGAVVLLVLLLGFALWWNRASRK